MENVEPGAKMAKHNHHALATCVPADVFDAYFAAGIRLVEDREHARVALRNLSRNHAENRSRIGAAGGVDAVLKR